MVVGEALREAVGAEVVTVTVVLAVALAAAPLQVTV
jgi:hypothetical protein